MIRRFKTVMFGLLLMVSWVFQTSDVTAMEIVFSLDKRNSKVTLGRAKQARVIKKDDAFIIEIELLDYPRQLFAQLTQRHKGKWIYLTAGKEIIFSGTIPEPILDGTFQIDGLSNEDTAQTIVSTLMNGSNDHQ